MYTIGHPINEVFNTPSSSATSVWTDLNGAAGVAVNVQGFYCQHIYGDVYSVPRAGAEIYLRDRRNNIFYTGPSSGSYGAVLFDNSITLYTPIQYIEIGGRADANHTGGGSRITLLGSFV